MQYSTHEAEQAKQEFVKIKRKTTILTLPIKLCIVVFFFIRIFYKEQFDNYIETTSFYGIRLDAVFFGFTILMFILAMVATFTWKCPNCDKRFGRERNFKHCMHCGIELED